MLYDSAPLIYIVDDDEEDCVIMQRLFTQADTHCLIRCMEDGSELMVQLTHQVDNRLPDVIFLDLHMPILNGFEVLTLLKQDDTLAVIPVVILSASAKQDDVDRCYALGCEGYIIKNPNLQQIAEHVSLITRKWLS